MRFIKRVGIAIGGFTVLIIGIAMIVLPGPAVIVIPAGLAILALEFAWAKRLLVEVKERGSGFLRRPRRS
jgi:tellurite resistance protein TerC